MNIQPLNLCSLDMRLDLEEFASRNFDYDFYVTRDNERLYMMNIENFKILCKSSFNSLVYYEDNEILGFITLWKSEGGGVRRRYIKLNAVRSEVARCLLNELLNRINFDVFLKIRKDSRFINIFRRRGFRFLGGRGAQILMRYKPTRISEVLMEEKSNQ